MLRPRRFMFGMAALRVVALAALIAGVLGLAPGSPTVDRTNAQECQSTYCVRVTVELSGGGSGRVQSATPLWVPDGVIHCLLVAGQLYNPDCSHLYENVADVGNVPMYFLVTPLDGSQYCETGSCFVDPQQRLVLYPRDGVFPANFTFRSFELSVGTSGSGSGFVLSSSPGLSCGDLCDAIVVYGTSLVLTAVPDPGSTFAGWTDECMGQPAECRWDLVGDTSVTAVFEEATTPKPAGTPRPTRTPGEPSEAASVAATPSPTDIVATTEPPATAVPATADPSTAGATSPPSDSGAILILLGGFLVAVLIGVVSVILLRRPVPPATG